MYVNSPFGQETLCGIARYNMRSGLLLARADDSLADKDFKGQLKYITSRNNCCIEHSSDMKISQQGLMIIFFYILLTLFANPSSGSTYRRNTRNPEKVEYFHPPIRLPLSSLR